jgi:hypothetical protein
MKSSEGSLGSVTLARSGLVLLWILGLGCGGSQAPAASAEAPVTGVAPGGSEQAAVEKGGWENLVPPSSLEGFRRVPLDPLAQKPVWQVRADGSLFIDGSGAKEMLLSEREFGDGVLHVEWRFVPSGSAAPAPAYNGGVYVRTALDGKSWVQLQVARAAVPPVVGDLIAQVPGQEKRVEVFQQRPNVEAPLGEWNTYDVDARGATIALSVNGQPTVVWPECPLAVGHVGLQAEGAPIEVRALRFQPHL